MSFTLSQVIEELQSMRRVLPGDAPVRAWLLSPAAGAPEMAVLEVCGVTGGVDRRTGRLCATLQLRRPHDLQAAEPAQPDGTGAVAMTRVPAPGPGPGAGAGATGDQDVGADAPPGPALGVKDVKTGAGAPAGMSHAMPAVAGVLPAAALPTAAARAPAQTATLTPAHQPLLTAQPPGACGAVPARPPLHEAYPGPPDGEVLGCPWW